jgi:hypothetical protein
MDTKTLISESKARFAHNSAKAYLKEKYESRLIVADQGGLWRADQQTISFLHTMHVSQKEIVLMDTFNNPVKVNTLDLFKKLYEVYNTVMEEWYNEWKELEGKR